MKHYDFVIVGGGIIGLTIARELHKRHPQKTICILEKESDVAMHSSGRNSGVLHAGFYYTADSLKARFTREGNKAMTEYCLERGLKISQCGKLVVAADEQELEGLRELKRRGDKNGVELHWVEESAVHEYDPSAKTFKWALFSPNTASVNPVEVCQTMKQEVLESGVDIVFNAAYKGHQGHTIHTSMGPFRFGYFINAAGLYADKIAHEWGVGTQYTIIPFKGIYLEYVKNREDFKRNIYPVPNLGNPFLGVHFTKTAEGRVKIGPTAIPAFWRENYQGFQNFRLSELFQILYYEAKLFLSNSFNFRTLAFAEIKKYHKPSFIRLADKLVKHLDHNGFGDYLRPGIRAQLLDKRSLELVQDFVVEEGRNSLHVLNAVSPAFTCSIPFSQFIVDKIDAHLSEEEKHEAH